MQRFSFVPSRLIKGAVGNNRANDDADVRSVKRALSSLDFFETEDKKPDCANLETALANAESILVLQEEALAQAEDAAGPLENQVSALEDEITELEAAFAEKVKNTLLVSVGGGGTVGAIVGLGLGRSFPATIAGTGAGAKKGMDVAKAAIEALESEITILRHKKDALMAELGPLKARIETLQPSVEDARALVDSARDALDECQSGQR